MSGLARVGDALATQFAAPPAACFSTGFLDLDRLLDGGVRAGESTLIGGFYGHAKSALAEQIALHLSCTTETLYLPLEMGEDVTRLRMGAKLARCSIGAFRRGGLDELTKLELNTRKLTIYEPRVKTIAEVEKLIARRKHRVVIIDHVRHFDGIIPDGRGASTAHRIAHRIPELARAYGVHVIMLQQLNPKTAAKKPLEWEFMDSKAFEQAAQNVWTIFRPYHMQGYPADMVAEIRIHKNRNGSNGKIHYRWVGETMSLWQFTDEELAELNCCGQRKKERGAR